MRKFLYFFLITLLVCAQAHAQCTAVIAPATSNVSICAGNTTVFSANTGTGYQWKLNGTNIAGATNQTYTASVAGSYTVTVYNGSCSATSNAVTLIVNALPNATITATPSATVCMGDTIHLCVAGGPGYTYQWSLNGNVITSGSGCLLISYAGSFTVAVASPQGCINTSAPTVTTIVPIPTAPAASSNTPVGLGQNILLSATSNSLSGTYQWMGPNSFTSNQQNPQLANATVAMSGIYSVSVMQNGCSSPYANTTVVVSDLVWPGDANYDLVANNLDVLAIGLNYGATGPVRNGATNNWTGQYCNNWTTSQASSTINMKHVDCDGNGTVNASDTLAVTQNYGQTHLKEGPHQSSAKTTGLPDLYFDTQSIVFAPGAFVAIPVRLGTLALPIGQIYGLAAQVKINGLTLTAPMQMTYTTSWVGSATNTVRFSKAVTNNQLDWTYVRIDHQNIQGNGVIATLNFTVPTTATSSQFQLYFDNVTIIDKLGNPISGYNVLDDTSYVLGTNVPKVNGLINAAAIVPNPSSNAASIQLDLVKATDMHVSVCDASGRIVWTKDIAGKEGKQQIQLPTANLATGIYQVVLKTKEGAMLQTIKWMKD